MKILITGATGGLGRALCREALSRGWKVIALSRRVSGEEFRDALASEQISFITVDFENPESIIAATDQILKTEKVLDGIVNNASILLGREDNLETLNLDDIRRSMEVNAYGPMELTRKLLPLLRNSESAGIVNVTSTAAAIAGTREIDYAYSLSKGALNMFSEKLRIYLQKDSIRVAAVHPGWMRTEMGGMDAPVDPMEAAMHILDILCGKQVVTEVPAFVNRFGAPVLNRNDI